MLREKSVHGQASVMLNPVVFPMTDDDQEFVSMNGGIAMGVVVPEMGVFEGRFIPERAVFPEHTVEHHPASTMRIKVAGKDELPIFGIEDKISERPRDGTLRRFRHHRGKGGAHEVR